MAEYSDVLEKGKVYVMITAAAVIWVTCAEYPESHMLSAEYPDVTQQVREEQRKLRPDLSAPITGEVLNEMVYTRQVVKEVLRFRPPAPMVPQVQQHYLCCCSSLEDALEHDNPYQVHSNGSQNCLQRPHQSQKHINGPQRCLETL